MNLDITRSKKIAVELEAIRQGTGSLKPEEVVEYARSNPASRLHGCFTWDDGEAAEKWRIEEARGLIVSVMVQFPKLKEPTRLYVSLSTDRVKGNGYRIISEVLSSADSRAVLVRDAMEELESVKKRFRHVSELVEVWSAIRKAGAKLARKQKGRRG